MIFHGDNDIRVLVATPGGFWEIDDMGCSHSTKEWRTEALSLDFG